MDADEQEYEASNLRHFGWVCYRKRINPRKWRVTGRDGSGKHSFKEFFPTKAEAVSRAADFASKYVGSHPESGPLANWTYEVKRRGK